MRAHWRTRTVSNADMDASLGAAVVAATAAGTDADALEELTEADQLAVQAAMVEMDQKQTMKLFSTIGNVAFTECVSSFRGRSQRHRTADATDAAAVE